MVKKQRDKVADPNNIWGIYKSEITLSNDRKEAERWARIKVKK